MRPFYTLFSGNGVIVDGLTAGEQIDFCLGAGGLEDLKCLLSVGLTHVLTVEQVDELSILLGQLESDGIREAANICNLRYIILYHK